MADGQLVHHQGPPAGRVFLAAPTPESAAGNDTVLLDQLAPLSLTVILRDGET